MEPDAYKTFNSFQGSLPPDLPPEADDWTADGPDVFTKYNTNNPNYGKWVDAMKEKGVTWVDARNPQPFMSMDADQMQDDAPTPKNQGQAHLFPHPGLSLPFPELKYDFRMAATLNPLISVGPTPSGQRNWISISGGNWSGSFGNGIVVPGGQDSQIIHPNGAAELSAHYLLQTLDEHPAHIVVKSRGWRTGPPEILAALRDPEKASKIDPRLYKFRVCVTMETGDERYAGLVNYGMWIGSGMRKANEVIYDAYRVR